MVIQARKYGPYLVPHTLLMPGDVSLYIMNDSDSHTQFKYGIVVAMGQEAVHREEVSAADGSFHLDGIIRVGEMISHCQPGIVEPYQG